jgi:hypothetical protein
MKHALTILVVAFVLTGCVTEGTKTITNATASAVLDQGSFTVGLTFAEDKVPQHLLVAHPTRRLHPNDCIMIIGEDEKIAGTIHSDELAGRRLHGELLKAISDPSTSAEIKSICVMLDRVLTDPNFPWDNVQFSEKWF